LAPLVGKNLTTPIRSISHLLNRAEDSLPCLLLDRGNPAGFPIDRLADRRLGNAHMPRYVRQGRPLNGQAMIFCKPIHFINKPVYTIPLRIAIAREKLASK
jgi:hypothetical protein